MEPTSKSPKVGSFTPKAQKAITKTGLFAGVHGSPFDCNPLPCSPVVTTSPSPMTASTLLGYHHHHRRLPSLQAFAGQLTASPPPPLRCPWLVAHPQSRPSHAPQSPSPTTEVIPSSWFHSTLARDKFLSRFLNRSVHACEGVDFESFKIVNLGFIDYLLRNSCEKLLTLGDEYYPQLVHMFYANLRIAKVGPVITLECQVKFTRFTLTESNLNQILGLPIVTQPNLSTTNLRRRCLAEFVTLPPSSQCSNLSYLILHHDPRLLYYVLVRTILPKPNSTDSLNNKTLELLYLLMTDKPVNYARYILSHMSKIGSIMCPAPLAYSNLLTLVFNHFGVPIENKICDSKPLPVITPSSLKNIQFFQTAPGV